MLPLTAIFRPREAALKLHPQLVAARFLTRLNRFAALVEMAGQEVMVHIPNSGRMRELLKPGRRLLLTPVAGEHRKTHFDLTLVDSGTTLVSADTRLPNGLVAAALAAGELPPFQEYPELRREVRYGDSRLDFLLESPGGRCYLEVKSVTLVVEGVALFPDAPTIRGVKHLRELSQAVAAGHRAAALFVVQRDDALTLAPNDAADPDFGAALRAAQAAGVEVYAYGCQVSPAEMRLAAPLPVQL